MCCYLNNDFRFHSACFSLFSFSIRLLCLDAEKKMEGIEEEAFYIMTLFELLFFLMNLSFPEAQFVSRCPWLS